MSKLTPLGLTPTGNIQIHTPSTGATPATADVFDVGMIVWGSGPNPAYILAVLPVTASDFQAQGIDGLLGRDFLSTVRVIYSGPDNWFGLSF